MANPIQYSLVEHHGLKRILIHFEFNNEWNARMRKVPDAKWSKTLRCWHIPDTEDNRKKCGLTSTDMTIIKPDGISALKIPVAQTSKSALSLISNNNKKELQNSYSSSH